MTLKETTVYLPTPHIKHISGLLDNLLTDKIFEEKTGYFHTKESLIELLGSVFDKCWSETGDGWNGEIQPLNYITEKENEMYLEVKESVIQSLFNTEEDGK